jgi:type I restriction enzyme S subunit
MQTITHNILGKVPEHWNISKFDEVAELIHGYQFRTTDFTEQGIKVFKITQINGDGTIDLRKCDFINSDRLANFKKNIIGYNDILMALTGATIGKVARFKSTETILQNYRVGKFISRNKEVLSEDYLYFFLTSKLFFNQLLARQTQSAQQNIGKEDINNMTLCFPDIDTQTTTAEILSSLDDKIELNNKINQELEALAQALFKQWFIDFEFPDTKGQPYKSSGGKMVESELGEIPKGWSVVKLEKLITVKYGKDHKHLNEGTIPVYGSGGIMRYADKPLYDKVSILIPRKGTLSNLFFLEEPFWSVDTMFYTEIHNEVYAKYIYYYLLGLNLASMNVGSAVPSMTTKVLNELPILSPSEVVITNFDQTLDPVFSIVRNNNQENEKLKELRDYLLPKLISGQLEVSEPLTETVA